MKNLTKAITMALLCTQILVLVPTANAQYTPGEKHMLMVSAYYSPLPDQSFYIRGSYEADKVLNGRGTNGADGSQVYAGMLAAPRTYAFGTRVRIPGLGVGEVHDRGGAIYSGRSYDRIDVWMGSGEEGLSRALNWGMRLVEGEVYTDPDQVESGMNFTWVDKKLSESLINRLRTKTFINPQTFTKPITKESSKSSISELQDALRLFGYYHGEVDGVYDDETKQAVLTFQMDEGVIQGINDQGAGYFGAKTQQALKSKSENFNSRVAKEQARLKENIDSLTVNLGKKATGDQVYSLQQMLWELGYYNGSLNSKYDSETMDAVLAFQKEHGVINNEWEKGAGYFGKKTHDALVSAVGQRSEKLAKYPAEMQVWVPANIDLPKLDQLTAGETGNIALNFKLDIKESATAQIKSAPKFTKSLGLNDKGDDVKTLQDALIKGGYLAEGLNTGTFGGKTQEALVKLQIAKGIIKQNTDMGAGNVGPKTMEALNSLIK
jgi:peptidoglycan hydrolase-like protein with peptidoglycan-binding domain/3D (Asp-Asp-Asp) domain-containing protein